MIKPGSRHYQLAQQTIDHLHAHWMRLPDGQRRSLGNDLQALQQLRQHLRQREFSIAVFGLVNRGKSAVLNALLGKPELQVGPLNGVTRSAQTARWDPGLGFRVRLIDTPGLNEVEGKTRERLAWDVARSADLILFVISGDITQIEYQALLELRTLQKPILLVFNKIDLYPDQDQQAIYAQITHPRLRQIVSPNEIVMVAASPAPIRVRIHWPDEQITYDWEQPKPHIGPLHNRIREILSQEGESLLALNALVRLRRLNGRLQQQQLRLQAPRSQRLQWRLVAGKVAAIGLLPGLDLLIGILADLGLVVGLMWCYRLPLSRRMVRSLLRPAGMSLGLLALAELSSIWVGLSDLAWGAPWLPAAAAAVGSRWLIQGWQQQICSDQIWGIWDPQVVAARILEDLPPGSILSRLRREVGQRLGLGPTRQLPSETHP